MDNKSVAALLTQALSLKEDELLLPPHVVTHQVVLKTEQASYTFPSDSAYHLTLVVEPGVRVLLSEPQGADIHARVIELILLEGAQVTYQVYKNALPSYHFFKVSVAAHATFSVSVVQLGESKSAMAYECTLHGVRAEVSYEGRVHTQGSAQHRLFFHQIHTAPDTISNVDVKTVAQGTSTYRYEGTIVIEKNAVHSQAHQQHKTLILSPQAQVSSIPNLEVHTHQVACGHGSAIAHLDADHLFYLASRGLSYEQAKDLIVQGFLDIPFL